MVKTLVFSVTQICNDDMTDVGNDIFVYCCIATSCDYCIYTVGTVVVISYMSCRTYKRSHGFLPTRHIRRKTVISFIWPSVL